MKLNTLLKKLKAYPRAYPYIDGSVGKALMPFSQIRLEEGNVLYDELSRMLKPLSEMHPAKMLWLDLKAISTSDETRDQLAEFEDNLVTMEELQYGSAGSSVYKILVSLKKLSTDLAIEISKESTLNKVWQTSDDSSYVPMSDIWLQHFNSATQCSRFLDNNLGIRSRKPSKKRREVHLADWHNYWKEYDRKQSEALDHETLGEFLIDKEARESEIQENKIAKKSDR